MKVAGLPPPGCVPSATIITAAKIACYYLFLQSGMVSPGLSRVPKEQATPWSRDLVAGLSLANLVYLKDQGRLYSLATNSSFWARILPPPVEFFALIANILLLGLLFTLVFRVARRQRYRKAGERNRALYAGCLLILGAVTFMLSNTATALLAVFVEPLRSKYMVGVGVLLALAAVVVEMSGRIRLTALGFRALLLIAPMPFFTVVSSAVVVAHLQPTQLADGPLARALSPPASAPHIVWVIYDEWDEALSFPERPPGLRMSEADRLRTQSFYSDVAYAASHIAGENTTYSMSSLTTGMVVDRFETAGPRDLRLWFRGTREPVRWSACPNVFSRARNLGLNTAVVGWGLPYCRVLNASLTGCDELPSANSVGLADFILQQDRGLFESQFRSIFGQSWDTTQHARAYHDFMAQAAVVISAQRYNLTLLHSPIPHAPYFYNRRTGKDDYNDTPVISLLNRAQAGYVDALALVDRSIGDLRRTMERAGVWDSTTVLFTGDHDFRARPEFDGKPRCLQVPFILKLAHQRRPLAYTHPFSAMLTHDLLLALLRKQVTTPEEMGAWLNAHRQAFPVPGGQPHGAN